MTSHLWTCVGNYVCCYYYYIYLFIIIIVIINKCYCIVIRKTKLHKHFTVLMVCWIRTKSTRWLRGSWTHVPLLPTRKSAVARTESRNAERTLSENWWHEACHTDRSAVCRSGRFVSICRFCTVSKVHGFLVVFMWL